MRSSHYKYPHEYSPQQLMTILVSPFELSSLTDLLQV
jgi:hypothetical protein